MSYLAGFAVGALNGFVAGVALGVAWIVYKHAGTPERQGEAPPEDVKLDETYWYVDGFEVDCGRLTGSHGN